MKVKLVSHYQTSDGRLFKDQAKAISHQNILDLVEVIKTLVPSNDNLGSSEYIQLTLDQYNRFKDAFYNAVRDTYPSMAERLTETYVRGSIVGRMLCDSKSPLNAIWWVLECIDDRLRMYNQPYYANHPAETASFTRVDSA